MEDEILQQLGKVLKDHEANLSYKMGGSFADRLAHVIGQYKNTADNSIYECKNFLDSVKTQFKALEIIAEGLTSEGLNHTHKRVIANHIITMLRGMVDKIDQAEFDYNTHVIERYNFFRSRTPERRLYEERANLSQVVDRQNQYIKDLKDRFPQIFEQPDVPDLPF